MTDKLQHAVNAKSGSVTLKLSRLVGARQALQLLTSTPLPASIAMRVSRLSRTAGVELEEYDRQLGRLLKECGETKDGQHYTFPDPAKRAAFDSQVEALGEEQVTLPAVTLTLQELGDREFPASVFGALDWVFPEMAEEGEGESGRNSEG